MRASSIRVLLLALAVASALPSEVAAQFNEVGTGVPQAGPNASLEGLSAFITKTMAEWKVPGMAVAIVKDGSVIFAEGFGVRDVEQGLKVTPRTILSSRIVHQVIYRGRRGHPGRRGQGQLG